MKTAISVEGELLEEADRAAREMGLSRSRLFSLALRAYLRSLRQQEMVEKLNRIYGEKPDTPEARTVRSMKAKFRSVIKERW